MGVDLGEVVDEDPLQRSGVTLFMDGGAHMLLDFSASSAAVVNTDFRVGGGVAARFPSRLQFLAAKERPSRLACAFLSRSTTRKNCVNSKAG